MAESTIELDKENEPSFESPSKFEKTILASSSDESDDEEYKFDTDRNGVEMAKTKYKDLET